jgi:aryl-alcohol dehydrogenase-like predicted oxidoreductase
MTFGLQCDEGTAVAILDRAAEGGIDFLDTSDAYPLARVSDDHGFLRSARLPVR